ncbi:MAG: WhiB family transcriptional regulator [Betaproteobacteria bacterium]|nr:WhiB family transcriptional regulator [Betaproteobacteria bacterium]
MDEGVKFTGAKRVCGSCPVRDQCLRHPQRTTRRAPLRTTYPGYIGRLAVDPPIFPVHRSGRSGGGR